MNDLAAVAVALDALTREVRELRAMVTRQALHSRTSLSIEESATVLGCERRRVFQLLADGTLERAPRYGKALRIYKDSVEQALARPTESARKARKRKPTGDAPPLIPADADLQSWTTKQKK